MAASPSEMPPTEAAPASPTAPITSTTASDPPTTDGPSLATAAASPDATTPEALGPASDTGLAPTTTADTTASSPIASSALRITLMLTTGARHPYRLDDKYLRSRKVPPPADAAGLFDPREISAYKLKELIWTDWRSEWEPRPTSPSSIRLICMGRMLEDKSPLKDAPFKLDDNNVVHMTVKPADFLDDDEASAAKGKSAAATRVRDGGNGDAGCRCVIL